MSGGVPRRETTLAAAVAGADLPGLRSIVGDRDAIVASATHDSRAVEAHSVFCCVRGERFDGHDFASAAVAAGARALLVDHELDLDVAQVVVADVRAAMGPLSAAVYGHPSQRLEIVGVTGTNGKTTTTHLLAEIFSGVGRPVATIGTLSGAMTTPEAPDLQRRLAELVESGVTTVAMEVSSHALALQRVDGTRFVASVFTNLGRDHLDFHGTQEAYFAAKARLFDSDLSQQAIINSDDEAGRRLAGSICIPCTTYSASSLANVEVTMDSLSYTWRSRKVSVPIGGAFNVSNSLAALTAAVEIGVDIDDAVTALAAAAPVPGRFEPIQMGQDFDVIVDFAHTPDALAAVLATVRAAITGRSGSAPRIITVFGCGGNRDRAKRPEMGRVAAGGADLVVVTSDNPRDEDPSVIIDEIYAGIDPDDRVRVIVEPDRSNAIEGACRIARAGDVVLIAGKGHEQTQTIGDSVIEFDDRAVARRVLGALR